jgi:hypothetical protein
MAKSETCQRRPRISYRRTRGQAHRCAETGDSAKYLPQAAEERQDVAMSRDQLVRFQISDLVANGLAGRLPDADTTRTLLHDAPRRRHGPGQAAIFPESTFEAANRLRACLLDMAQDIRAGRYRCIGVTAQSVRRCADQVRSRMFVSNALRGVPGTEGIDDYLGLRHGKAER